MSRYANLHSKPLVSLVSEPAQNRYHTTLYSFNNVVARVTASRRVIFPITIIAGPDVRAAGGVQTKRIIYGEYAWRLPETQRNPGPALSEARIREKLSRHVRSACPLAQYVTEHVAESISRLARAIRLG